MLKIVEKPGTARPWAIVDDETGAVVATSETREKAERSMGYRIVACNAKKSQSGG